MTMIEFDCEWVMFILQELGFLDQFYAAVGVRLGYVPFIYIFDQLYIVGYGSLGWLGFQVAVAESLESGNKLFDD